MPSLLDQNTWIKLGSPAGKFRKPAGGPKYSTQLCEWVVYFATTFNHHGIPHHPCLRVCISERVGWEGCWQSQNWRLCNVDGEEDHKTTVENVEHIYICLCRMVSIWSNWAENKNMCFSRLGICPGWHRSKLQTKPPKTWHVGHPTGRLPDAIEQCSHARPLPGQEPRVC